jgi:hypothetical protein
VLAAGLAGAGEAGWGGAGAPINASTASRRSADTTGQSAS